MKVGKQDKIQQNGQETFLSCFTMLSFNQTASHDQTGIIYSQRQAFFSAAEQTNIANSDHELSKEGIINNNPKYSFQLLQSQQ